MDLLILASAGPLAPAAYRLETTRIINETELLHTSVLRLMTPSHLKKYSTSSLELKGDCNFLRFRISYSKKKYLFMDMAETDDTQNNANISP